MTGRLLVDLGADGQDRGRLEEADDWYRKSLTIREEFGDRPGMAITYAQLGVLAKAQAQPTLALEWFVRAVTLFEEFPSPLTQRMADYLARLTRQFGFPALQDAWRNVTGQDVPQAVLDYVASDRDDDQSGG